ncbi:hypothetical protein TRVL_04257 [Trypanosoma vivax]|uniref:Peptidase S1 domain-containing protein n=1 Tax=Trypanosoma vivax (strain Y486) TaxID=1055687 RepID=G0TYJ9_TRYVY|nr:hypothetical protein TRVL_04257 [Trypanosoma vivax]CCC49046.1 conserved hypothetical protein [Trypanosoma vivax Y486]
MPHDSLATDFCGQRSCFPVMSFLHVPGKMSRPLWLMMGTAFLLRFPRKAPHPAAENIPISGSDPLAGDASCNVVGDSTVTRHFLLTAKHTFVPWMYVADPKRLKVPEEYRKIRFVVGRLYLPSAEGRALASHAMELQLVAVHPTMDVALLSVKEPQKHIAEASVSSGGNGFDVFSEFKRRVESAEGGLDFAAENPKKGDKCLITGYRGVGKLGLLDTFDPDLLQQVSEVERNELLEAMRHAEGKQESATTTVEVLDSTGMCRTVVGCCYHGMSGAPVLVKDNTCGGVLYGKHPDHHAGIGYVPVCGIIDWVLGAVLSK